MKIKEIELFKKVYNTYYNLHPTAQSLPKSKLYYLHREWFFPNHINLVLKNVKKIQRDFYPNADLRIVLYAGLLHDAGLVYNRVDASPDGHENRSSEYTKLLLPQFDFSNEFIDSVCESIEATDSKSLPESDEGLVVRNADAYSHLTSIHFFAKAYFASDVEAFITWFDKKIESTFDKISIPQLREEVEPRVKAYRKMIELYNDGSVESIDVLSGLLLE